MFHIGVSLSKNGLEIQFTDEVLYHCDAINIKSLQQLHLVMLTNKKLCFFHMQAHNLLPSTTSNGNLTDYLFILCPTPYH